MSIEDLPNRFWMFKQQMGQYRLKNQTFSTNAHPCRNHSCRIVSSLQVRFACEPVACERSIVAETMWSPKNPASTITLPSGCTIFELPCDEPGERRSSGFAGVFAIRR